MLIRMDLVLQFALSSVTEAPEEMYDTRPLFQRLEEQRMKKEAEYEEAHKLSKNDYFIITLTQHTRYK